MNLPINRHKCLIALANDIIADGVDIDVEDIERIIDIYERILITSSEQGCDNTKVLYGYIEPFARIDLVNINIKVKSNMLIPVKTIEYSSDWE